MDHYVSINDETDLSFSRKLTKRNETRFMINTRLSKKEAINVPLK